MEDLDSLRFLVATHTVDPDDPQVAAHHFLTGGDVRVGRQDMNALNCLRVVYVDWLLLSNLMKSICWRSMYLRAIVLPAGNRILGYSVSSSQIAMAS